MAKAADRVNKNSNILDPLAWALKHGMKDDPTKILRLIADQAAEFSIRHAKAITNLQDAYDQWRGGLADCQNGGRIAVYYERYLGAAMNAAKVESKNSGAHKGKGSMSTSQRAAAKFFGVSETRASRASDIDTYWSAVETRMDELSRHGEKINPEQARIAVDVAKGLTPRGKKSLEARRRAAKEQANFPRMDPSATTRLWMRQAISEVSRAC